MEYCPNCGIGLNNTEQQMKCCQNCETFFEEDTEEE